MIANLSPIRRLPKDLSILLDEGLPVALGLIFAMAVGATLEAVGIGLVVPFIQIIADPRLESIPQFARQFAPAAIHDGKTLIIATGLLLLTLNIMKNLYLFLLYEWEYRFIMDRQSNLACRLFAAHMKCRYIEHLQRNSSDSVRAINSDVFLAFTFVIVPAITILSEVFVAGAIFALLFLAAPFTSLIAILFVGAVAIAAAVPMRKRIHRVGEIQREHLGRMIKWVQQGFGAFKEARVLHCEDHFITQFRLNSEAYADSARRLQVAGQTARLSIETLCFAGLTAVVLSMGGEGSEETGVLPTLALFATAAFRLMPSMNRIIYAAAAAQSHLIHVSRIADDLSRRALSDDPTRPPPPGPEFDFNVAIEMKEIAFRYPNATEVALKGLNVRIPKGSAVALVGPSGSGKSTAVDLLLGLLDVQTGIIAVDGQDIRSDLKRWQSKIAYIPQPVFLIDDTIRRNVAFGVADNQIDEQKVWECLRAARLDENVRRLPGQLDSTVGEGGARLSGGQRQRIGIARVLYRNPDILILDEATSALDNETEAEVSEALRALAGRKTLIIVAHRLSTVKNCDIIYLLQNGRISDSGTFDSLLATNSDFQRLVRAGML